MRKEKKMIREENGIEGIEKEISVYKRGKGEIQCFFIIQLD